MLSVGPGWSIGSRVAKTAFLDPELHEENGDGHIVAQPPPGLVWLGLALPRILWKLMESLYGLRCAPDIWG